MATRMNRRIVECGAFVGLAVIGIFFVVAGDSPLLKIACLSG